MADKTTTILSLKGKIEETTGLSSEDMELRLAYGQLDDRRTVADYDFQDSELQVIIKVRGCGGATFELTFNVLEEVASVQFNPNGPDYRMVTPGLNFLSICKNPHCKANNDWVVVSKGFGEFDILSTSKSLLCPVCSKGLQPSKNYGCYMSEWKIKRELKSGETNEEKGRAETCQFFTPKEGVAKTFVTAAEL